MGNLHDAVNTTGSQLRQITGIMEVWTSGPRYSSLSGNIDEGARTNLNTTVMRCRHVYYNAIRHVFLCDLPRGLIKRCIPSVRPSVRPVPTIYTKSESHRNFKYDGDMTSLTWRSHLRSKVKVTENENVKKLCLDLSKVSRFTLHKTKMILGQFYTYCRIYFTSGNA